ncbi:MAG: protein-L-isoaspartate(D-aspartate) O-methyltransferase [Terriglobales bacterium]
MTTDIEDERFAALRQKMVNAQLRARGIRDQRVLAAMGKVPRHLFVDEEYRDSAYEDHPVPIGAGQTVSQPYIVAFMLEVLSLDGSERVLEIGTGSGYLTALLAELARQVYSVERIGSLSQAAESALQRLGYTNVSLKVGDGSTGWADHAPFDAIVVSAAAPEVPKALLEQLREAGRMIIPVGPAEAQELKLVRKERGRAVVTNLEACRFVPLIGQEGYREGWQPQSRRRS